MSSCPCLWTLKKSEKTSFPSLSISPLLRPRPIVTLCFQSALKEHTYAKHESGKDGHGSHFDFVNRFLFTKGIMMRMMRHGENDLT